MFVIHVVNLKESDNIINKNLARLKLSNQQAQQIQKTLNSIENVVDWKVDDPRMLSEDLRQQFLMKTRTRKAPIGDRASPRERIPLATTDFDDVFEDESDMVSMYTYNPAMGGTQV